MALPVVPATNIGMYAHLRESTSCDSTTNLSLLGLVTGAGLTFTPVAINAKDDGFVAKNISTVIV